MNVMTIETKHLERARLSAYTTYRIGGEADLLLFPRSLAEIRHWVINENAQVMGGGSNLLVADDGVRGPVVRIGRDFASVVFEKEETEALVRVEAGMPLSRLAGEALRHGYSGLEFGYGIPGAMGGAVIMNAGAHGGEIRDILVEARLLLPDGSLQTLSNAECGFGYRSSSLPAGAIVVEALLKLSQGEPETIRESMRLAMLKRKESQPLTLPSAGSIFKNPGDDSAGRLIEAAGLKGVSRGGATVSKKHGNFIVNLGEATARDVYSLITTVEKRVYEESGVRLQREIHLLGEFDQ